MLTAEKTLKLFLPAIKTDKYAFNSQIEDIEMFHTVKAVKSSAFCNCSSLKNIKFSENLKEIGDYAFLNCSSLKSITLPSSIKSLGEGVFKSCTGLQTIHLPDDLKILPASFFENCSSFEKIILPEGLETIGEECFSGCINLKEIVFPNSLKQIKAKAFKRCFSLKAVIFPDNLRYIGDKAFEGCKALTSVNWNGALEHIGSAVFPETPCILPRVNGTMFSSSFLQKNDYGLCPTITIPKGVKALRLGFENTLTYKQFQENRTCYRHILALEKYNARIFISENYYSYNNREELLIKNGEFDFTKYDSQFKNAEEKEKPIISAFRLAYPVNLKEKDEIFYKTYLSENSEQASLFATKKNEETVLKYIIDNFELTTDYCTFLYEKAAKNGFSNLQQILSQRKKSSGFDEINFLLEEILG